MGPLRLMSVTSELLSAGHCPKSRDRGHRRGLGVDEYIQWHSGASMIDETLLLNIR